MKLICNIVFTKNRPLQLDGYLRSLYRCFPADLIQTHIVYKPERFGSEYDRLFHEFPDCLVTRETDFHTNVMDILSRTECRYVLFGVDDTVFFDSVRFDVVEETFDRHEKDIFGFTLRFSRDSLAGDGEEVTELSAAGETIYRLNWKHGHTAHTRYPFELGCTFYRADLVRRILRGSMSAGPLAARLFLPSSSLMRVLAPLGLRRSTLKHFGYFFSPNTLESWPCRWSREHKDELPDFTYFQKICAVAIQVNLVNTTTRNEHYGTAEHTVEALNEKYRQGYAMDIEHVAANRPTEPSSGQKSFRLTRTLCQKEGS
ncbi:MAG: hypothetical protein ABFD90_09020 [Phycisphaerales bacterium]